MTVKIFSMTINNRQHTRIPFAEWTWGKIRNLGEPSDDFRMYRLVDVSRGGISFVSNAPEEFKRGKKFFLLDVEGRNLTRKLIAIVRYVKAMDDFGIDFKVGCEFLEVAD